MNVFPLDEVKKQSILGAKKEALELNTALFAQLWDTLGLAESTVDLHGVSQFERSGRIAHAKSLPVVSNCPFLASKKKVESQLPFIPRMMGDHRYILGAFFCFFFGLFL